MGSNSNRTTPYNTNDYVADRATSKDDHTSNQKSYNDAKLRGSIGSNKANEIIKSIDNLKSRGLF